MKRLLFLIIPLFMTLRVAAQDTLRIDEAIALALQNNYSIIIARNNAQITANNNNIGNAGFLPVVGADATYQGNITNSKQTYYDGREKSASNAKSKSLFAEGLVNWTIFDGLSMFTTKAQLAQFQMLGENDARVMVENTIAAVILNYYGLVQYEQMAIVLQKAIQLSMERKSLAETKLKLGSGSELDLLQATVDMHADSSQLIQQQNQIRGIRIQLNTLMVRNVATAFAVTPTIPVSETLDYNQLLDLALSQNPQLIAARARSRIAELEIRQAKSALYPQLDLYGGYSYTGSTSATGLLSDNKTYGWNYGITATMNLFNGLNNLNNIRNARILSNNSDLAFQETELAVRGNVLQLFDDYRTALMLVKFEFDNVALARENTRIAFEKYNLGAMSDIDLRTTQQKQLDAERRLLVVQFQAKGKEVELEVISGTLVR